MSEVSRGEFVSEVEKAVEDALNLARNHSQCGTDYCQARSGGFGCTVSRALIALQEKYQSSLNLLVDLRDERDSLKEKLKTAKTALEFYADIRNYWLTEGWSPDEGRTITSFTLQDYGMRAQSALKSLEDERSGG